MQVEAVYNHGRLELPENLRLKHDVVTVVVTLPDDEVLADPPGEHDRPTPTAASESEYSPGEPGAAGVGIRAAINEILGPWKQQIHSGPPLKDEDFDRLRYQSLGEKYLDRQ